MPDTSDIYRIDPNNFDEREGRYLARLLSQNNSEKVYQAGRAYEVSITLANKEKKKIYIRLTDSIIYRERKYLSGKISPRYEVIGKRIAGGTFGDVHNITRTLQHNKKGGMIAKTHKKRCVKIINLYQYYQQGNNEAELLAKLPYLRSKRLIMGLRENGEAAAFLVMKKIDFTLAEFLKNESGKLTFDQRARLSSNLLRALQEQIHDKGMIHYDIKSNNILIDPTTLEVFIIDIGMAIQKTGKNDAFYRGTPKYVAPEIMKHSPEVNEKADVFSMGIVLSEVWGASLPSDKDLAAIRKSNQNEPFRNMFDNDNGEMSMDEKIAVREQLDALTNKNVSLRKNPNAGAEAFDNLRLGHKLRDIRDGDVAQNLHEAQQLGLRTAEQLRGLAQHKYGFETIQEPVLIQVLKVIDDQLTELTTNPLNDLALAEFLDALNIEAFKGLTTIADVRAKMHTIANELSKSVDLILDAVQDVETTLTLLDRVPALQTKQYSQLRDEYEEALDDVYYIVNKHTKYNVTLDNADMLTKFYSAQVEQAIARMEETKRKLEAHTEFQAFELEYGAIFKSLELDSNDSELNIFKNHIKIAISKYLAETLTQANVEKGKRGASKTRKQEINDLLNVLQNANDNVANAEVQVNNVLSTMKFGFFGRTAFGSKLHKYIKKELIKSKVDIDKMHDKVKVAAGKQDEDLAEASATKISQHRV